VNPAQIFIVLVCFGVILFTLLAFEIAIFRIACALCGVQSPGVFKTIGIVLILLVVPAVVDGGFSAILYEVYTATGYPLWEAGVVQFFLALPVHMFICSTIHAKMMSLRIGQGVGVWLVEKLMKLALLSILVGFVAVIVLIAGNGK
jgi:hypothetical protein